jgi:hypothetical protein
LQCNCEKTQVSSKKSAKTNLSKKSAKLFALSRAAGDLGVVTSVESFVVVYLFECVCSLGVGFFTSYRHFAADTKLCCISWLGKRHFSQHFQFVSCIINYNFGNFGLSAFLLKIVTNSQHWHEDRCQADRRKSGNRQAAWSQKLGRLHQGSRQIHRRQDGRQVKRPGSL